MRGNKWSALLGAGLWHDEQAKESVKQLGQKGMRVGSW